MRPVDEIESLMGEGVLSHLARFDKRQHAVRAVMDDLLVQLAQQGGPDTTTTPLGVDRQCQEVCVGAGHSGNGDSDTRPEASATAAGSRSLSASTTSLRLYATAIDVPAMSINRTISSTGARGSR